jgi:hypothetical protein
LHRRHFRCRSHGKVDDSNSISGGDDVASFTMTVLQPAERIGRTMPSVRDQQSVTVALRA